MNPNQRANEENCTSFRAEDKQPEGQQDAKKEADNKTKKARPKSALMTRKSTQKP